MKVVFTKKWKNARGKTILKGAEESFVNEIAIELIEKGIAKPVEEWTETGLLDKDGKQILKLKE